MYTKVRIILISICFLLVSVSVYATDYKQWIPLLPETLGGLAQSGKPEGVNMEMGGQSWSSLQQKYSNNSENISMMIVSGYHSTTGTSLSNDVTVSNGNRD